MNILGTV